MIRFTSKDNSKIPDLMVMDSRSNPFLHTTFGKVLLLQVVLILHFPLSAQRIGNYRDAKGIDTNYIPVSNGTYMGIVDQHNKVIIPASYDAISFFDSLGLAMFRKEGLYGIVNTMNVEIVPPISEQTIGFNRVLICEDDFSKTKSSPGMYLVQTNDKSKWMIFSPQHPKKTSDLFTKGTPAHEDRLPYSLKAGNPSLFRFGYRKFEKQNGRVNFIDTLFNEVLPMDVINGAPVSANLFVVWDETGKAGLMNRTGTYTVPPFYYNIDISGHKGIFLVTTMQGQAGGSKGLINAEGRILLDTVYTDIQYLQHDQFKVTKGGGYEIVDLDQRVIVPLNLYKEFKVLTDGLYSAHKQNQNFIVDTAGVLIGGPYTSITGQDRFGMVYAHRGDSTFYYNTTGNFLFSSPTLQKVTDANMYGFVFSVNGKQGLADRNGVIHLQPIYSTIELLAIEDAVLVSIRETGEIGVYSFEQKWVIPIQKDVIMKNPHPTDKLKTIGFTWMKRNQIITYANTLKSPEIKQLSAGDPDAKTSFIYEYPDRREIFLMNDEMYTFPSDRNLKPLTNGKVLFFEQKVDRQKQILNTDMVSVLPEGYINEGVYPYKESYVCKLRSADNRIGWYMLEGKWLIEPNTEKIAYPITERMWVVGKLGEFQLCKEDLTPVRHTLYNEIKSQQEKYIICSHTSSKHIDVYDWNGNMISERNYSGFIIKTRDEVTCRKSPEDELISCVLDSVWAEKQCYPFAEIFPIESNNDYLIAKDLYDYGVINRKGNVVIPFNYRNIYYVEAIGLFKARKGSNVYDFLTPSGEMVIADAKGQLNSSNLIEPYMVFTGDENRYVFNKETGRHIVVPAGMGALMMDSRYPECKMLTLKNDTSYTYMNADTGLIYQIE